MSTRGPAATDAGAIFVLDEVRRAVSQTPDQRNFGRPVQVHIHPEHVARLVGPDATVRFDSDGTDFYEVETDPNRFVRVRPWPAQNLEGDGATITTTGRVYMVRLAPEGLDPFAAEAYRALREDGFSPADALTGARSALCATP